MTNKARVKILVGICSGANYIERRQRVREPWMKEVHLWEKSRVNNYPQPAAGMNPLLFDLGFHRGEGFAYLKNLYGIDDSWTVFCFEPNPVCRPSLNSAGVIGMPFAAWTKAERVSFQREAVCAGGNEDGEGSHIASINFDLDCRGGGQCEVLALNFPVFLRSIVPRNCPHAFVVLKMDIEGSEYGLLRAMLDDGSIDLVDILHVEFHQNILHESGDGGFFQIAHDGYRQSGIRLDDEEGCGAGLSAAVGNGALRGTRRTDAPTLTISGLGSVAQFPAGPHDSDRFRLQ